MKRTPTKNTCWYLLTNGCRNTWYTVLGEESCSTESMTHGNKNLILVPWIWRKILIGSHLYTIVVPLIRGWSVCKCPPFPTLLSYSSWSLTSDPWKIKVKLGMCWGLQNTTYQKDTTQSVFMCVSLKKWKYTVYIQVFLEINQCNVSCTWCMRVVMRVVKGCSLSEWQKRAAESALHTSVWNVCERNEMCWLILCFGIVRNTSNCFIRSHRNRKSAPKNTPKTLQLNCFFVPFIQNWSQSAVNTYSTFRNYSSKRFYSIVLLSTWEFNLTVTIFV